MPVVYNSAFPQQVGPSPFSQSFSTQLSYGQMLREVCQWNPNLDPMVAGRFINNRYRQIVDRRSWYGLKVRGNASVPNIYSTGTATVSGGSPNVTGVGTNWTGAMVGLQFRTSFTMPWQTIITVNSATSLTLDTPYPGLSGTYGFQIVETYLTFGGNVKRMSWAVNQLFGWPIKVNVPVEVINARDTWRQNLGWATIFATRAATADGQYQVEVWPTPYNQQVFPFEAYTQPPNMVADNDAPVAWIRADLLVTGAIADALLHRPKQNTYYDPAVAVQIAGMKEGQFKSDLLEMENADEGLQQQAVTWDYGAEGVAAANGSAWGQQHDV